MSPFWQISDASLVTGRNELDGIHDLPGSLQGVSRSPYPERHKCSYEVARAKCVPFWGTDAQGTAALPDECVQKSVAQLLQVDVP